MMRSIAFAAVLAASLVAAPIVTRAQTPEEDAALRSATRLDSPDGQVKAFRAFVEKYPQSKLVPAAHFLTTRALLAAKAPSKAIVDEARLTLQVVPATQPDLLRFRIETALTVVDALVSRKEMLEAAREIVATVAAPLPADAELGPARHVLALADATVVSALGRRDDAIAAMRAILVEDPDEQQVLFALARELAAAGRIDEAIDAYVAGEAVYNGGKTDGSALRTLYAKKHGSLDGLDARLATAREASMRRFALDARRFDAPAPDVELKDLSGATVKLSDLKGQVVVIDFWATWCGPCRIELPHIQALANDFDGKGVRVLAINVEGAGDVESWDKLVRTFVAENKYTFTVLNDFEQKAHVSYQIEVLPSVFVVDKTGRIRYLNRGYEPTIRDVLSTQIRSLAN